MAATRAPTRRFAVHAEYSNSMADSQETAIRNLSTVTRRVRRTGVSSEDPAVLDARLQPPGPTGQLTTLIVQTRSFENRNSWQLVSLKGLFYQLRASPWVSMSLPNIDPERVVHGRNILTRTDSFTFPRTSHAWPPSIPRPPDQRWQEISDHVSALAWSPDKKWVAAAAVSGPVTVFDAGNGTARLQLSGHTFGTSRAEAADACTWLRRPGWPGPLGIRPAANVWRCQAGSARVEPPGLHPNAALLATAAAAPSARGTPTGRWCGLRDHGTVNDLASPWDAQHPAR